jgi:hypothetical protein
VSQARKCTERHQLHDQCGLSHCKSYRQPKFIASRRPSAFYCLGFLTDGTNLAGIKDSLDRVWDFANYVACLHRR